MKRVQVAVVGGGEAGFAAARATSKAGAEVAWFREFIPKSLDLDFLDFDDSPRSSRLVWGLFAENVLAVASEGASFHVQADHVILATGSTDTPCPFAGGSLPGVFNARAMQVMIDEWQVLPGNRFVVIGGGPQADDIVSLIKSAGGVIASQVDPQFATNVVAHGDQGVEFVEVNGIRVDADVVVVAIGRQPDIELALMAECEVGYSEALGGFVPLRDEYLRTTKRSILVAGDAAGLCDPHVAAAEGWFAGVSVAHAIGLIEDRVLQDQLESYSVKAGDRLKYSGQLTCLHVQV